MREFCGGLAAREILLCLSLAALGGASTRAEDEVRGSLASSKIEVRASYRWPESCQRGFAPVLIQLENGSAQTQQIMLSGSALFGRADLELEQALTLAPGEMREIEWLLPLLPNPRRDLNLRFASGFESDHIGQVGPSGPLVPAKRAAMIFAPRETSAGPPAWLDAWTSGRGAAGEADGASGLDWARVSYADLPSSWRACTSLDAVILDAESELPDERQMEMLARYTAAGGTLVVLGAEGAQALAARSPLADCFEPRFERASAGRLALRTHGMGLLLCGPATLDDLRAEEAELVGAAVAAQRGFAPRTVKSPRGSVERGAEQVPSVGGLAEVPVRELLVALLVFVLLIGPLNFWLVQRARRPVLLLVTVPVLSLAFSLGLLALNFASEGFSTRVQARSLSVLDQRTQRRATAELRAFYAPFSLGPAFTPRASTALFPVLGQMARGHRPRFLIDPASGALAGDYLPSRREARQVAVEEASAAERLAFERRGERVHVTNLLGVELRELEVYDGDGVRHVLEQPLDAGASAALAVAKVGNPGELFRRIEDFGHAGGTPLRLPRELRELYCAAVAPPPWLDRAPLHGEEGESEHLVLGVLALGELARR